MRQTLALLTSYPIAQPRSGGQLRAAALCEHYASRGFEVTRIAAMPARAFHRREHGPHDLEYPLGDPRAFDGEPLPQSDDLQSGRMLARDERLFARFLEGLPERLSVFHLEQPWLLPAVQRARTLPRFSSTRVVYGSQNVEAPLKESICRQLGVDGARVIAAVEQLEREACQLADLTLAVSASDAQAMERLGARRVVVAPNGIHQRAARPELVAEWQARLRGRRVALFVGSAHPPNAAGFIRAFGDALGFVPPDAVIVAAGRVGEPLRQHYQRTRYAPLNESRLFVTGELDDDALAAIKALASVFVLPIFEGGGSNIKTSEALLSGRPVIASETSLRGFDAWRALPELTVAREPAEWARALTAALTVRPEPPRAPLDALRAALLWENTLAPVAPAVLEVLR